MKVQIVNPWNADKPAGETVQMYGVDFVVLETSHEKSVLVADLPEEEAQAMIDAGRVVVADLPEEAPAAKGKK